MSTALARRLKRRDSIAPKIFVEINCSVLKDFPHFVGSIVFPHVINNDVTLFFDEASELPHDVTMALLTILNPNDENKNSLMFNGNRLEFDLRRVSWIFATSEIQKVFSPLVDRLERLDLEEYDLNELAMIVVRNTKSITIEDKTLHNVALVLRGNPRAAQKMATKIKQYCTFNKTEIFDGNHWSDLIKMLQILPMGLSPIELSILTVLKSRSECSLTQLSAKTGMSRESLQKEIEVYLLKNDLIEIRQRGRAITRNGIEYLRKL